MSKTYDLEVVNLADKNDKDTYETGPSEFLDFIKDSTIFFTDSFHGAVFSILFKKSFVVFNRSGESMNSRIDTLLDKFNLLENRGENFNWNKDIFAVDYSNVDHILNQERRIAIEFLKEAMNEN